MPVSAGREFLSIPGPTVIPDAVLAAMQKPGSSPAMHRTRRAPAPLPVLASRGAVQPLLWAQIPRPLRPARQYP